MKESKLTKTGIPYLDYVWNITHGCNKISAGCQNCWAVSMSKRLAGMSARGYDKSEPFKPTFCDWKLNEPLQIKKPSVIGVSFMGDLFHDDITELMLTNIFVAMQNCNQHTFVICTKRPENMYQYLKYKLQFHFDNIWFGCTVENNRSLNDRIDAMDSIKNDFGYNTWVSVEPLLEDISEQFEKALKMHVFDGVIVGGESGAGARYCNPEWIENIYSICIGTKVQFYFKQFGTNKQTIKETDNYGWLATNKGLPWKEN